MLAPSQSCEVNTVFKVVVLSISLCLLTPLAQAQNNQGKYVEETIKIIDGPTQDSTFLDMKNDKGVINFEYTGCDPNPSIRNIGRHLHCETPGDRKANKCVLNPFKKRRGNFGVVRFFYKNFSNSGSNCANPKTIKFRARVSPSNVYSKFKKNCNPVGLVIADSEAVKVQKHTKDPTTCNMEPQHIKLPGFGQDKEKQTQLAVNHNSFQFGKDYIFKYDRKNKKWRTRYIFRDSQGCATGAKGPKQDLVGDLATIPIMYRKGGKSVLAASVTLNKDGTAIVRSHDKAFDTTNEILKYRPYNTLIDEAPGAVKIDLGSEVNGVPKSSVTLKDRDGNTIRTAEMIGRNQLGKSVDFNKTSGQDYQWCGSEHCFRSKVGEANSCKSKSNSIDMSLGGNGNLCVSCFGRTPGVCGEEPEYKALKTADGKNEWDTKADEWANHFRDIISGKHAQNLGVAKVNGCSKGVAKNPDPFLIQIKNTDGGSGTINMEINTDSIFRNF